MAKAFTLPVRCSATSTPSAAELLKLIGPLPDASIVVPPVPIVNSRSVLTAGPTYFSVEPWMYRLLAAFDELPMLLVAPPLASVVDR